MEIVKNVPDGAPFINIEGKKGESLFYRPLIWGVEEDMKLLKEQYTEYEKIISEAKEERLLAMVGTMSMEEALDLFLRSYIPDYSRLEELRDFTLYVKIQLACSLKIIPVHIFDAAILINNIRNKFAHNLNISCFNELDEGIKGNLRQKYRAFFTKDTDADLALEVIFHGVVDGVIIGLEVYASNLRVARDYIHSDDFLKDLIKRIKGKSG